MENDQASIQPRVSVVMPSYNSAKTIEAALISTLMQQYPNMEIIVVNDGSTDTTRDLVESFQANEKNITIIDNPSNYGIARSRNIWTEAAQWEYIAVLDADDQWIDFKKTQKQIDFLLANPDVWILGTNGIIRWGEWKYAITNVAQTDEKIRKQILSSCPFIHSSVIYKKAIWEKIGWYPEGYKYSDDLAFQLLGGKHFSFANLPDYSLLRDFDCGNISHVHKYQQAKDFLSLSIKYRKEYPWATPWIIRRSWALLYKILFDTDIFPVGKGLRYLLSSKEKIVKTNDIQQFCNR